MSRIPPDMWKSVGGIDLEPNAEKAVRSNDNCLVIAGPGAGKTELLAQRACYLLETGLCPEPQSILAISFKRDAARNLSDRVERRCGRDLARRFHSFTYDACAKSLVDRFMYSLPEDCTVTSCQVV
jgi:DNA helicase-2/ATP-dependent DNA helicase PcrA